MDARTANSLRVNRRCAAKGSALLLSFLIAACHWAPEIAESPKEKRHTAAATEAQSALRVKTDARHDRVWVLHPDYLEVHDRRTNHLIRRIPLPHWNVAEFVCEPDIAFDRAGAAYISHNLEPKVWQINPNSFELKEHSLRLVGKETLDIGFSAMAFTPDGALYALASTGGSVWRMELADGTAEPVYVDRQAADRCAFQ
jgi:hypothetical protein